MSCSALIVLVGEPATGKSSFASVLQQHLGASIVAEDVVRKRLVRSPDLSADETRMVYDACEAEILQRLSNGELVVFDGVNMADERRRGLAARCPPGTRLLYVRLVAPPHVLAARLAERDRTRYVRHLGYRNWTEIYQQVRGWMEPLTLPHLVVNSASPFDAALRVTSRMIGRAIPADGEKIEPVEMAKEGS
jgi:predicted kinase